MSDDSEYTSVSLSSLSEGLPDLPARPRAPPNIWSPVRLFREAKLEDELASIQWAVGRGILRSAPVCRLCRKPAYLRKPPGRSAFWYDGKCRKALGSPFEGTVFARSRLPFARALMLGLSFAQGAGYAEARRTCVFEGGESGPTDRTIALWYRRYRRLIGRAANPSRKLGGPGRIVQVDEAMIHGRRKYGVGRCNTQVWVLCAVDDRGLIQVAIVRNRTRAAIYPLLSAWIERGSSVHTDGAKVYLGLSRLGFIHSWVNHKKRFVAEDGTHTQRIEAQWRSLRRKFSRGGIRARGVSGHLREWIWRRACRRGDFDPFEQLLQILRLE